MNAAKTIAGNTFRGCDDILAAPYALPFHLAGSAAEQTTFHTRLNTAFGQFAHLRPLRLVRDRGRSGQVRPRHIRSWLRIWLRYSWDGVVLPAGDASHR